MPLTLHLSGQGNNGPLNEVRTLDRGSLALGRGAANDWVLPDPEGQLSRFHCSIALVNGRYVLTDLSTNGVFLNGNADRVPRDGQAFLTDGDEIRLGGYVVRVSENGPAGVGFGAPPAHAPAPQSIDDLLADPLGDPLADPLGAAAAAPFSHPAMIEAPRPRGFDPFDTAESPAPLAPLAAERDHFQGKAPDASWNGAAQRDNVDAAHQYYTPPAVVAPVQLSDADLDELLGGLGAPAQPAAPPTMPRAPLVRPTVASMPAARPSADIDFDDLIGDLGEPGGQSGSQLGAAPGGDPFGAPPAAAAAAPPAAPPLAMPVAAPPVVVAPVLPPPVVTLPVAEPEPFLDQPHIVALPADPEVGANPFEEPTPAVFLAKPEPAPEQAAAPAPAPAAVAPTAPPARAPQGAATQDAARLLAAFLEGAGNPRVDLAQEDPEAYFRLIGTLMRTMVESLRDVLMSRAEVKRSFGVEQTMLQARNNNVLKFSVTPEDAVAAILQPTRPGYLPPLKATEEAFNDLRSHQLAVMAGVQAALSALLKRFDPAALEARSGSGGLGSLLTGGQKARHWEVFRATYEEIARGAEDDFEAVFSREFARAYREQERKF